MNGPYSIESPQKPVHDPRIRLENDQYRVTAPNGRSKDGRFFINGQLVIEKKEQASLGESTYTRVLVLPEPSERAEGDATLEQERQKELAIWSLLCNGGE